MRASTAFLTGWGIGVAGVVLAALADERFAVVFAVPGILLLYTAVVWLTNDREWSELAGRPRFPRSYTVRIALCGVIFMTGTAWCFGGVVGMLVLLGVD